MRNTGEGAVYENTRLTSWIVSGGGEDEKQTVDMIAAAAAGAVDEM